MISSTEKQVYRELNKFTESSTARSWWVVLSAVLAAAISMTLGFYTFRFAWYCSLFFWPFIWIFWSRLFIIVHDCGHQALFKTKIENDIAGTISGAFTTVPFALWRHIHNQHHLAVGHLERRHVNPDLWTMTKEEYRNSGLIKKAVYRFMRNGFVRVFITPVLLFVLGRFPLPSMPFRSNLSILLIDLLLGIVFYLVIKNDFILPFTVVYLIPLYVWLSFAAMMFYMQHQFEDTHWYHSDDWSNFKASVHGSSYMEFGPFMQWMSGNVGYHHVHHLNANIPFYRLKDAHDSVKSMLDTKRISFWNCIPSLKKKLWDEEKKTLVPYD